MKSIFFVSLLALHLHSTTKPAAKDPFRYNAKTGVCENARKQKGYNPVQPKKLFGVTLAEAKKRAFKPRKWYKGMDAECVDFRSFNFNAILKLHYSGLKGWNLRGARLDNARFFFAHMADADLRGAKLKTLKFGYTTIQGRIDKFTTYPARGCRLVKAKSTQSHTLKCRK